MQKRLHAARPLEGDDPARQADDAGKQRAGKEDERRTREEGKQRDNQPADHRIEIEALDGDLRAGLPELHPERRLFDVAVLGLLLLVKFLQRVLNGFAALRDFRNPVPRSLDLRPVRIRTLDRLQPLADVLLIRDRLEKKCVGDRAGAAAGKKHERQNRTFDAEHGRPPRARAVRVRLKSSNCSNSLIFA